MSLEMMRLGLRGGSYISNLEKEYTHTHTHTYTLIHTHTTLYYTFSHQWILELCPPPAIENYAALNPGVQTSVQVPVFTSFGYIPRIS